MTEPLMLNAYAEGKGLMYSDLPRCCDCGNRQWFEGYPNIFGKLRGGKWVCVIGRPLFDCYGVEFNTDPTQMRLTGPCGQEGKLFRAKT